MRLCSFFCTDALDTSSAGTLIATGSVDTDVRLWDPRDLSTSLRLRGHTDIVRCVKLMPDGQRLLSCGSDQTIRVWNIGERRCEQVLTPHHGASVFSLLPQSNHHFLSADANGHVRRTELGGSGSSSLLCTAAAPVLRLHIASSSSGDGAAGDDLLFVATAASTVECWSLPSRYSGSGGGEEGSGGGGGGRRSRVPSSPGPSSPGGGAAAEERPLMGGPSLSLPGGAAVRRHATLPSRVQVLTEYDTGEVAVWDLPSCSCVQRYPPPPSPSPPASPTKSGKKKATHSSQFDDLLQRYEEEVLAVPTWFSTSSKSGSLEVTLEPTSCFAAEAYAVDLGLSGTDQDDEPINEELRVNLGERFLSAVFGVWCPIPEKGSEEAKLPCFTVATPEHLRLLAQEVYPDGGKEIKIRQYANELPQEPPKGMYRWLVSCVVDGQYQHRDSTKLSFLLLPQVHTQQQHAHPHPFLSSPSSILICA